MSVPIGHHFATGRRLARQSCIERGILAEATRELDAVSTGRSWGESATDAWARFIPWARRRGTR